MESFNLEVDGSGDEPFVPTTNSGRPTLTLARGAVSAPPGTESTDFDLFESRQYLEHMGSMSSRDRKNKGMFRWVLLVTIGLCTAFVGIAIDKTVELFFKMRADIGLHLHTEGYGAVAQYGAYVSICLTLAGIAGFLVCYVEPLAAGSGIPEVKCFLNGVRLPNVVALKTLIAKAPGVMFSVSAGMPCGKEGPMIHSGAIIGGVLAKAGAGPLLRAYRNDVEQRDFVVAGAAAGVAAAFGAPLGGVMFAMEEGATYFTPLIMLRTFVCCTASTMTVRFFLTGLNDQEGVEHFPWGTMGAASPLSFGAFDRSNWQIWELPVFMLMGVAGGLAGALFNSTNTKLTRWRMKYIKARGHARYFEVFFVTFVIASITFWMPVFLSGGETSGFTETQGLFRNPGGLNIFKLFHDKTPFNSVELLIFGVIYYCLACWCYGLGLPSGLFVPSLLNGAIFGRLVGQLVTGPFGLEFGSSKTTDAGVYALMGATAMLSGMARITISLAVILMEASGTVQWALPIFVVTMCSKWAGDAFTIGLYDIHIGLKHIPLLEATPEKEMLAMTADEIMKPGEQLISFQQIETAGDILKALEDCDHHGFPVLEEGGEFIGLVKRETLKQVLWRGKTYGVFQDPEAEIRRDAPCVPYKDERHIRTEHEIRLNLSSDDLKMKIDLSPYTNEGCFTVPEHASVMRVHKLFRSMGLRHLPVVSRKGMIAGMISRADLHLLEEHHEPH